MEPGEIIVKDDSLTEKVKEKTILNRSNDKDIKHHEQSESDAAEISNNKMKHF